MQEVWITTGASESQKPADFSIHVCEVPTSTQVDVLSTQLQFTGATIITGSIKSKHM